jgi:alanyl-tRNA synthetase
LTVRLYRDDPYLLEFEARVSGRAEHDGRPAVLLDRTAFYAESGGQPWDTGTLETGGATADVVAVVERDGDVLHVVEGPGAAALEVGQAVRGRVDGERRRDHRQQHHGQHLLSRAFVELAGANTVSFHLGAREVSIDLDREVTGAQVAAAARRANEVIWEAREVSVRTVSRAEAEARGVPVPEQAGDAVRLVEAAGFDLQPCGGTHPRRTSEVGLVLALGHERYKGGTRVRFACGHRALALADQAHGALRETGALLSAAPDAVPGLVARTIEQLAQAGRRERALQEQVLEVELQRMLAEARAAGAGEVPVLARVFDGWDVAQVRQLAVRLTDGAPCVALLAARGGTAQLVFARSEHLPHDVAGALQATLRELGGRGGGRGRMAQGGCERTDGLEDALARAAAALRAAGPA